MQKFLPLCLASALLAVLAACGGGYSSTTDEEGDTDSDFWFHVGPFDVDSDLNPEAKATLRGPAGAAEPVVAGQTRYGSIYRTGPFEYRYRFDLARLAGAAPDPDGLYDEISYTANGVPGTARIGLLADPLAFRQTHLRPSSPGGDLNVTGAWREGLTGKGERIALIGGSPDVAHEDLRENARLWDGGGAAGPAGPADGSATSLAGIIAAASGNGLGGRGVAGGAELIAFGACGAEGPQADECALRTYREDLPASGAGLALEAGGPAYPVSGRSLPEPVYGPAAGNGAAVVRPAGDFFAAWETAGGDACVRLGVSCANAAADGALSPYAVTVAALGSGGGHASYSAAGAHVWIAAPGGDAAAGIVAPAAGGCGVRTATAFDRGEDPLNPDCAYTDSFYGTAAAAASVAGVAALVREAARTAREGVALTPAQLKYILAKTAVNDLEDPALRDEDAADPELGGLTIHRGWRTGAAGMRHSSLYGFGRADAAAAAELARNCAADPDCRARGEAMTAYRAAAACAETGAGEGAPYRAYECTAGNFANADGSPADGAARIEAIALDLAKFSYADGGRWFDRAEPGAADPATMKILRRNALSQVEVAVNGDPARTGLVKQWHEGSYGSASGRAELATAANYLEIFRPAEDAVKITIRTAEPADPATLGAAVTVYAFPLEGEPGR